MSERARDLAWEAMIAACGYTEPVTDSERGRINAALKELRGIYPEFTNYAVAVDIAARAEVYRTIYPDMPCTPQALTGNWSNLDPAKLAPPSPADVPPPPHCATCSGAKVVLVNVRADGSEEYAPCPDCHPNPNAAGYWRYDGTRYNPPEPRKIREAMLRLMESE
jgi:hypothetical protein